ncbi:tRNA-dihydrouridine(47) synthase [NAD(P)(+)] [Vanrija pseudolonga]|uniref:tRNA-dihydrouridine(47) synthase [NAD(P)(+)] n=1 Tax=Vanrija pseudolonga TaxID=143232 RepID=A0AAF1BJN0_9TREE|nr:tRNA-dihydrouridine(47) synthase [NAD(P)(+)] [Vanrija pseudolonga]
MTGGPQSRNEEKEDELRGRAGVAAVKAEYIVEPSSSTGKRSGAVDDDAAEAGGSREGGGGGGDKRQKNKKGFKTRTTAKGKPKGEAAIRICKAWETGVECPRGTGCKFQHSWDGYFEVKPHDVNYVPWATLVGEEPYVVKSEPVASEHDDLIGKTLDLGTTCPVFKELGYCPAGWRCRFLGAHVRRVTGEGPDGPLRLGHWEIGPKEDPAGTEGSHIKFKELNWTTPGMLKSLKQNSWPWDFSPKYLHHIEPQKEFTLNKKRDFYKKKAPAGEEDEESAMNEEEAMNAAPPVKTEPEEKGVIDGEAEAMDVPMRPEEKRRLNWENGLYLAPLTTVGNLPFRRLCVDYGATITISEMALAQPLVTGSAEEWALVRRHESEKMFGVQLAGGFPNRMVPAAELLAKELGPSGIDFVDINMGCPIDLIFQQGAGSALMDQPTRLGKILVGMNRALGEIPLTVKFRTGILNNKPNAHKLMPRYETEWGVSAMTLHGRSRQQRYSRLANWDYIKECVEVAREAVKDAGMAPIPIFGNGDCFSAQGYYEAKEKTGVDGVMLARGALIKPWLFTEIAERREWDISATERLEGIRKFAEYGLSHWGSDTLGVNLTRRFLCEALSFQHRYIPIGLLERMPPMINERPPSYKGRNELETLLASPYVGDWLKIAEMFLGPPDESFTFSPKHKSNAYGSEEAQG